MMHYFVRRPWDLPLRQITPVDVYRQRKLHRREFLESVGISGLLWGASGTLGGCAQPSDAEIDAAGKVRIARAAASAYPAPRNRKFTYGREETDRHAAARWTNFYEFSSGKDNFRHVASFQPEPWSVEVDGLCAKPRAFDLDDIHNLFSLEERAYRHRCVETWAMCVPWTGFPLRELLILVEPKPQAAFVALQTFFRPEEAPAQKVDRYPWPYTEGLTIAEAMNELALLATGIYGEPLPKQHGSPIRLVVPWKYGFKSIKSVVRITLTDRQPATFWNTEVPAEYDFQANVNPDVPHPRWSQKREWMLGTREEFDTVIYNGYGEYVGGLYG